MVVNTILLDFSLDNPKNYNVKEMFENVLSLYFSDLLCLFDSQLNDGGQIILYTNSTGVLITFRIFLNGLLTLNIEFMKEDEAEPLISLQQIQSIEIDINLKLRTHRSKAFPAIKRGASFDVYLNSSDERIVEYDFDTLLFEECSRYQKVQIAHSKTLGNMLILDGLQNLSERDTIYTETLMMQGIEDYRDKDIVILGGGDGALLNAVIKEEPRYVYMLELDDVVIRACSLYLRSCCGTVLDDFKGSNYEIIIGNCIVTVEKFIAEGKKFDYVFGDLTDSPLQICSKVNKTWDFFKCIIKLSFQILKPHGKFITHCCGVTSIDIIEEFENMLSNLDPSIQFSKTTAFVPSFMEDWVFYSVWR